MANRIRLLITDDALYVANTGRPIDRRGVISISRQYLSSKGETPPDDTFSCSDRKLVDAIRAKRLSLYREEPNDLKEHASQETQTRRDYAGRTLWELLQNADDAMAPSGCPSNELIGAKGLGFKSVLEISDRPEIHSGVFHFAFDPDRSDALLRQITSIPPRLVFRLPHSARADGQVRQMRSSGFATVIKLPFRDEASRRLVEGWLAALPHHFMLLCQHLRSFEVEFRDGTVRHVLRQGGRFGVDAARATLKISEAGQERSEEWRIWSRVWPSTSASEKRLSAAIAVQVQGKTALPSVEELPLHVFYPTQESVLSRFLVHGSFELRSDRNHLLQGAHDNELLSTLGELATAVVKFLPPESVLELFEAHAKPPPANVSRLDRKIQRVLGTAVLNTAFVPTVGGRRVVPSDARTWAHDLPAVLNHRAPGVKNALLCTPELAGVFPALRTFGAEILAPIEYAALLTHTRCRDREECLKAARVAQQACLAGLFVSPAVVRTLSDAPFWLTSTGKVRPLRSGPPLVRVRPNAWPSWLSADDLDPAFANDLLGKAPNVEKPWGPLIAGQLLQTADDIIIHCLAPALQVWTEKTWSTRGWEALEAIHAWRPALDWAKISPFAEGDESDRARTALVAVAHVPRESKWVPTSVAYASEKIGGNSDLANFFRERADRPVVGMPPRAKAFGRSGWKALLRYLGVSWEPKIRSMRSSNDAGLTCYSRFWNSVTESRLTWRNRDWFLDYFPECLETVSAQSVVKMLEALLPVTSKLVAAYTKRSGSGSTHMPRPFASCADYQLRRECYLHCRPSLAHLGTRGVAADLYWPDRGIRGITPLLDVGSLPLPQRKRLRPQFVQLLGIQENLPDHWNAWLTWADQLAATVQAGEVEVKERFIREFYELFLRTRFLMPKPRVPKRVVCITVNGLKAVPPVESVWIDDPKFAAPDLQRGLILAGLAVFPAMLERGEGSVPRLGVRRASEVVEVNARYVMATGADADRLTKRVHQCRRAFAAICEKKAEQWIDPERIKPVHGLILTFCLDGEPAGERSAPAYREDGAWLVNLDGDPWEALAVVCAAPFKNSADLRHWFTAILRAKTSGEIAAILIEGGIPPYRLREIALPEDEPADDQYAPTPNAKDGAVANGTSEFGVGNGAATSTEVQDRTSNGQPSTTSDINESRSGPSVSRPTPVDEDRGADAADATLKKRPLYDGGSVRSTSQRSGGRAIAAASAAQAAARGLEAEAWFAGRLRKSLPTGWHPEFNVRDAEVRESDVVLTSSTGTWHIEIKCLTATRIFWSELERQKAKANPDRYCMALMVPDRSVGYRIYWSWDPLTNLLDCERRIDWVWDSTGQGPPLPPDSWQPLAGLRPPNRPADRMNYAIEVRDAWLRRLPQDNHSLGLLWKQLTESATGQGKSKG